MGNLLDFINSPTRAESPHGGASYVQMGNENRRDRHLWVIERRFLGVLGLHAPPQEIGLQFVFHSVPRGRVGGCGRPHNTCAGTARAHRIQQCARQPDAQPADLWRGVTLG